MYYFHWLITMLIGWSPGRKLEGKAKLENEGKKEDGVRKDAGQLLSKQNT